MQVAVADARRMLLAAGFQSAGECKLQALSKKLNGIKNMEDSLKEPEEQVDKDLLKSCMDALERGEELTLDEPIPNEEETMSDTTAPAKTNPKKAKAAKPAKAAKAAKPAKGAKPAKEVKGVDAFGNRVGSQAATINAALTNAARSAEKIAAKTGIDIARVKGHLRWLHSENPKLVAKTDDGYALK